MLKRVSGTRKRVSLVKDDKARILLNELDRCKSLEPHGSHVPMSAEEDDPCHCEATLSLKGHCNWGRLLRAGRNQMSLLSSKQSKKEDLGQ